MFRSNVPHLGYGCPQVASRKSTAVRSPSVRGRRKRAADFFTDVSSLRTDQDSVGVSFSPENAEKARGVGAIDQASDRRGCGKSNAAAGSDVLEHAYHAAMALSASPTLHVDVTSPANSVATQINLPRESRVVSESTLKEAAAAVDSPRQIAAPEQAKRAEDSKQEAKSGAATEEAGRAVEAEGLIWVDDTQKTAYSVRYVGRIYLCTLKFPQYYCATTVYAYHSGVADPALSCRR